MLILGLDPGTANTGYGFVEITGNNGTSSVDAVEWGQIITDKSLEAHERLKLIYNQLTNLLINHKPDVMVIEKIFFASNAKTAIRVGQAQGVMLLCAADFNLSVYEYSPPTIKKIITGNGRADKKMIQSALRDVFGAKIRSAKRQKTHFDNAADALGVALCHHYMLSDDPHYEQI